jgi:hypothetical protein
MYEKLWEWLQNKGVKNEILPWLQPTRFPKPYRFDINKLYINHLHQFLIKSLLIKNCALAPMVYIFQWLL